MNYILYDIALLAILAFFLWRGYRKGFVLTLCSLLAVFVALIGASILSNALAEPVATAVEPIVERRIQDTLTDAIQNTELGGVAKTPEELPLNAVIEQLKESKVFHGFADAFQKAVDAGVTKVVTHAAQALAHYVAVQIARTVIFAIAFFAVLIAWTFLSRALDLVAKLPVLNSVNRWGGGAVGLVKGALVLFIAAWLLKDSYIPSEAIENTYLLKFFCTASPLSFFL